MTPFNSACRPLLAQQSSRFQPVAPSEYERYHRRQSAATTLNSEATGTGETVRSAKAARLEAALLVAAGPLSPHKLAQFATLSGPKEVRTLVDDLNSVLDLSESSFRIELVASGYRMLTRPQFARWLDRIHHRQERMKLSSPSMETLAIVAYRQPLTRADVEAVRGVQCSEMLKQLLERGLIKITGEDDSLGRPYLYGTTKLFMEQFGLRDLAELPKADRLRQSAIELRTPPPVEEEEFVVDPADEYEDDEDEEDDWDDEDEDGEEWDDEEE